MASVATVAFHTSVPEHLLSRDCARPRHKASAAIVRRRPTPQQGRSLEILAHAIEYLVDSDLSGASGSIYMPPSEAARILMQLNRDIFAECKVIVPFSASLKQRLGGLINRKHSTPHPATAPRT